MSKTHKDDEGCKNIKHHAIDSSWIMMKPVSKKIAKTVNPRKSFIDRHGSDTLTLLSFNASIRKKR